MTTRYERPVLTRTQKKLMWAFLLGVLAVSLFVFQAVTYTAQQKEMREPNKQEGVQPSEGSASEPSQVK